MERELVQLVLKNVTAQEAFIKIITPACDVYTENGEQLVSRVKRGIQKKDFSEVYMLIDFAVEYIFAKLILLAPC